MQSQIVEDLGTDEVMEEERRRANNAKQMEILRRGYFAAADVDHIAGELSKKVDSYCNYLISNKFTDLWRRAYRSYYGMRQETFPNSWAAFDIGGLTPAGDQGEIVRCKVNHIGNLVKHNMSLAMANRPALQCRAVNSDAESLVSSLLGNGILEYELKEKGIESVYFDCLKTGWLMGEAYAVNGWDPFAGEMYRDSGNKIPAFKGDLTCRSYTPFEIIKDVTPRVWKGNNWYIVHDRINRYDAVFKYAKNDPDLGRRILDVPRDQQTQTSRTFADPSRLIVATSMGTNESDDIPLYSFFHDITPSMPFGRYVIYCDGNTKLYDGPLPFKNLATVINRFAAEDVIGTPFGFTLVFDLLSLQELVDKLYTVVTSNVLGSGMSNFWLPPGSEIEVYQMGGQRQLIESAIKPEVLELLKTAPEVYNYINKVESVMEVMAGVSAINRGDMPSAGMSGSAMAFLASQTVTFNSAFEANANKFLEGLGTGIINILQQYVSLPRWAVITGKQNRPQLKKYIGKDLEPINSVYVESTKGIMAQQAGRVAVADNLLAQGQLNREEYLTLIQTGQIEPMERAQMMQNLLIQQENELLLDGKSPLILITDNHSQHISEHLSILSSPGARENPVLVQVTLQHIAEHKSFENLLASDPNAIGNYLAAGGPQRAEAQAQSSAVPMAQEIAPVNPIVEEAMNVRQPSKPNLPKAADGSTNEAYQQLLATQR